MHDLTKIATCSYCGNRTVLQLAGKVQHELACASCGARLHTLKQLKLEPTAKSKSHKKAKSNRPAYPGNRRQRKDWKEPRRRRRKLDLWDMVEDVFDEITDIFD